MIQNRANTLKKVDGTDTTEGKPQVKRRKRRKLMILRLRTEVLKDKYLLIFQCQAQTC